MVNVKVNIPYMDGMGIIKSISCYLGHTVFKIIYFKQHEILEPELSARKIARWNTKHDFKNLWHHNFGLYSSYLNIFGGISIYIWLNFYGKRR